MKISWVAVGVSLLLTLPRLASAAVVPGPSPEQLAAVPVLDGLPRQIVPGVYTLGELAPVTTYLVESADGLVLIDTGYRQDLDRLAKAIASLGLDPNRVAHILVTHRHLDHWMSMGWIRSRTGARTYMGRADAEAVERGLTPEEASPGRLMPPELVIPPTPVDYKIDREEVLPIPGVEIRAIPCAGHTPGSTCYYLETGEWRVLFGGDTLMSVWSGLGTYTTALHHRFGGDAKAFRATLERLGRLDVNLLLPGHPYFDRQELGRHPHPGLSSAGWRSILQHGHRELDQIERRLAQDGDGFLDERPKELADGVFYLGAEGREAAYALARANEVCLVDPHRLPVESLRRGLERLGLRGRRTTTALITKIAPERVDRLRRLAGASGMRLVGDAATQRTLGPVSAGLFDLVEERTSVEVCGYSVEAEPVLGWERSSVAYFVALEGELVALTGGALLPLTADYFVAAPSRSWSPFVSLPASEALALLERRLVTLWLPAQPFAAQNAHLYEDEWLRMVRCNRRTLAGLRQVAR